MLKHWLRLLWICTISGVVLASGMVPALAFATFAISREVNKSLPSFLDADDLSQKSVIYGINRQTGKPVEIASFYTQNRIDVSLDEISLFVRDAAIAVEDPRFYTNHGVDLTGSFRALLSNLLSGGGSIQGGSSITQQYVKNMLLQRCEVISPVKPSKPEVKSSERDKEVYARALKKYNTDVARRSKCIRDVVGVSLQRKIREVFLALQVNRNLSKNTVLRNYLNIVNYGGSIYGIEAASRYYFSKHAKDLTLPEAATLIGIINSPSVLRIDRPDNPNNGKKNGYRQAKARRDYVLKRMLVIGKITEDQYKKAEKTQIEPRITYPEYGCAPAGNAAFFCDYIQHLILDNSAFGKTRAERKFSLMRGGYRIYTTLDIALQNKAAEAMSNYFPSFVRGLSAGAALVTVEPGTGNLLAMVQNTKYSQDPAVLEDPSYSAVNLSTDFDYGGSSGFQVGSTYKLFTLIAWLRAGKSLNTVVDSAYDRNKQSKAFSLGDFKNTCTDPGALKPYRGAYEVKNAAGTKNFTVMNATKQSVNTAYMAMALQLDLCDVKKAALDMGLAPANIASGEDLISSPSSILGINQISPLKMAEAYATIAAGGRHCPTRAIIKILDRHGKEVPIPRTDCKDVISQDVNAATAWALKQVITGGTATQANPRDGIEHIAKTGTTDNAADSWIIGGSTKAVTAIWTGVTTNRANFSQYGRYLRGKAGVYPFYNVRYLIWREVMRYADSLYPGSRFPAPDPKYLVMTNVIVPNVIGMTKEEAKLALEQIGLVYEEKPGEEVTNDQTVTNTDPSPGSSVPQGTSVTVMYASDQSFTIPNVIGMTKEEAVRLLSGQKLNISEIKVSSPTLAGKVISVLPGVGTSISSNSVITITVGKRE